MKTQIIGLILTLLALSNLYAGEDLYDELADLYAFGGNIKVTRKADAYYVKVWFGLKPFALHSAEGYDHRLPELGQYGRFSPGTEKYLRHSVTNMWKFQADQGKMIEYPIQNRKKQSFIAKVPRNNTYCFVNIHYLRTDKNSSGVLRDGGTHLSIKIELK